MKPSFPSAGLLRRLSAGFLAAFLALPALTSCSALEETIEAHAGYLDLVEELERVIETEMESKDLPAFSIVLVDDQQIVWARGFGVADAESGTPATAASLYRVGSVSKLLTDMALMQLVERGEVDLDAPVSTYLPGFRPHSRFAQPITLRHLMSHRSGLVREPPVGHYFDATAPSLEATVDSLNQTSLVYAPGSRTKYSNAAIAVVGRVIEEVTGEPFERHVETALLEPIGFRRGTFAAGSRTQARLVDSYMWTYDGRRIPAPTFALGTGPAGNLCASTVELGYLLQVLFAGGARTQPGGGEAVPIIARATLESMWEPQVAGDGERAPFGLGFTLSEFEGRRSIGHNGAVYGFSTGFRALPELKLGVAAVAALDVTNAVVDRVVDFALAGLVARREGRPLPSWQGTRALEPERARALDGRYVSTADKRSVRLIEREGKLFLERDYGGVVAEVREGTEGLIVDDRIAFGPRVGVAESGSAIEIAGTSYERARDPAPSGIPVRWRRLIGEYGWDHNTLYILEKDGVLWALIEWFFYYPLREEQNKVFAFPDHGLYHGEKLVFETDDSGRAHAVRAAGVRFARRDAGTEVGETFRITPLHPEEELRAMARAAEPPNEDGAFLPVDLVELRSLAATIDYDIRYAGTNNFMGMVFYQQARAFLQRPAAEALVRAHRKLNAAGYGLLVHDAYRPWFVTKMFWEATPEDLRDFVADPSQGSRHNRGCAVDLTLYELATGRPVDMVGGYDEFTPRSFPYYPGGTARQRWLRKLLRQTMNDEGFTVYEWEWWHFDYKDWRQYPIGNRTFEEIDARE